MPPTNPDFDPSDGRDLAMGWQHCLTLAGRLPESGFVAGQHRRAHGRLVSALGGRVKVTCPYDGSSPIHRMQVQLGPVVGDVPT